MLSPLRPTAAPVQDAPRKISTPVQSNASARKPATPQPGAQRANRPTNPAVQSSTGQSGFDGRVRQGGGVQLNPQGTDPLAGKPGTTTLSAGADLQAKGTVGTQAVGALDDKALDKLFDQASKSFESILKSLGHKDLPQIDDPTQRLQQRSDYLGGLLTADPSLKDKISEKDLAEVAAISNIFLQLRPSLEGDRGIAVDAYLNTAMRMYADWPPPPDEK